MHSSYQNLQTEPAFVTNQKYIKSKQEQRRHHVSGVHKNLSDCCYSISNLALIIACIIAIIYLVKFLQDDLLYDYGEHILSLRFYRQLIYIIVVVPLTLLVPIFNAASAFYIQGRDRYEVGPTILRLKISYQLLTAILVFVALVFIAPSIRYSYMANQIDFELRKHMSMRYMNMFSYEFLDRLQEEYQCCDHLWYRSNYADKLPITCYLPDGTYSRIFELTCAEVLGSMISNWCGIIAACLVAILVSLAVLLGVDILELLALSSGQYNVESREQSINQATGGSTTSLNSNVSGSGLRSLSGSDRRVHEQILREDQDDCLSEDIAVRLKLEDRERNQQDVQVPLLSSRFKTRPSGSESETIGLPVKQRPAQKPSQSPSDPVLTRAHYVYNRPQSPVFISDRFDAEPSRPAKGVLKKTSSFQRIDQSDCDDDEVEEIDLAEHQRQIQRELQTRRSLLNVRFAE